MPRIKRPTIEIKNNEWVTIEWLDQHEECCDCGARHRVDYRVVDGQLQMRAVKTRMGAM